MHLPFFIPLLCVLLSALWSAYPFFYTVLVGTKTSRC